MKYLPLLRRPLVTAVLALTSLGCLEALRPSLHLNNAERMTAVINHIDRERRLVLLGAPDGRELTVEAGPAVNLGLLRVGDRVAAIYHAASDVTYSEAFAVSVEPVARQ